LRNRVNISATGSVNLIVLLLLELPSVCRGGGTCVSRRGTRNGSVSRALLTTSAAGLANFTNPLQLVPKILPAHSPGRLHDAWNLALERQGAEAQAADAELAQERPRTPAQVAAVVLAAGKLRLPFVFNAFCGSCHFAPDLHFFNTSSICSNFFTALR
jgi:hypothetical protein